MIYLSALVGMLMGLILADMYYSRHYIRKQPRARDGKFLSDKDHEAFKDMTKQLRLELGK